ncbi:MAG TPA: glycosyltransferase family 1 protein, partial [Acetobacteraceae bacterium]|nr:glycosyltransferase family 1 protein [Acetobacteraceae bacterium]
MHVLLDVSRLIACARRRTPSGIDRVEAAYVRQWLGRGSSDVTFVARSPLRGFAAVPRPVVADLHGSLDQLWTGEAAGAGAAEARAIARRASLSLAIGAGRSELKSRLGRERRSALLVVSHRLMERPEPIARLRRRGVSFIPLVHDLIPATHPEYARPGVAMQHLRRLATVARLADGVIVNSAATSAALRPHLVGQGDPAPMRVAPLGLDLPGVDAAPA